jgi:translation initiation factor IF-3
MQTNNQNRIRVNFQIKVPQVRVIQLDGTSVGVMPTRDALKLAQSQGLDLVEINPKASPPVCKIIDFGKYKYDEKKKQSEIRKKQKIQELKEIVFRPNTEENDLLHKLAFAKEFLSEGNKVKFTIKFRGREITHPQVAKDKLIWIIQQLDGLILSNPEISMEGKFMWMIVAPSRN